MSNSFESSKLLAIIGSILLCLSFIPFLGIAGIILVLLGMGGLAEYYNDYDIRKNMFTGVIFGIIGFIVLTVTAFALFGVLSFTTSTIQFPHSNSAVSYIPVLGLLLLLVILLVFMLLMAIHFKKAFNSLDKHSGEHLFNTAGTLLLIGAILTIIGVGLFLIWISFILSAIAFFSLKAKINTQIYNNYNTQNTPPPPQTAQTTNTKPQYCTQCGSSISPDAAFCAQCGKHI